MLDRQNFQNRCKIQYDKIWGTKNGLGVSLKRGYQNSNFLTA